MKSKLFQVKDIELIQYQTKKRLKINELYRNNPTILFAVRSTSCPLCKRMTKHLLERESEFEALGITVNCIVKEVTSKEFLGKFWNNLSSLYIDEEYDVFKLVGDGQGFRKVQIDDYMDPVTYKRISEALGEEIFPDWNFMFQNTFLGGTVLLSQDGEVVCQSLEEKVGDLPDIDALLQAAKALRSDTGEQDLQKAFSPANLKEFGIDFSRIK